MNNISHRSLEIKRLPVYLSGGILLMILIASFMYIRIKLHVIQEEKGNELQMVADLKTEQLVQWNTERLSEVNFFSGNLQLVANLEAFLRHPGSEENNFFHDFLAPILTNNRYENIAILTVTGEVLYSFSETYLPEPAPEIAQCIKDAWHTDKTCYTDFYFCRAHQKIHSDIVTPIRSSQGKIIALMLFRTDPDGYLYPLIQTWPVPSKSSEMQIFKQAGDSVLFIYKVRHIDDDNLRLRISVSQKEISPIKALRGFTGLFKGEDYRGVKVFAYSRPVPGTAWFMEAKIDRNELFKDFYIEVILILVCILLFLALTGAVFFLVLQNRQKHAYKLLWEKQEELRKSSEQYHSTIEGMMEGCQILDKNWNYLYINPMAEKHNRRPIKELMGKNYLSAWPGLEKTRVFEVIQKCMLNDASERFENFFTYPDGSAAWFDLNIQSIPEGVFIMSIDITEKKKMLEELYEAVEKAEENDRLKTAFLHNISHEIRTPLNAIVGFSTILAKSEQTEDKRNEFLDVINESSEQLLSIITGIIAMASLEAGQEKAVEKITDINQILANVYDQFIINNVPEGITFSYHPGFRDDKAQVMIDPLKLMQVLVNLVGNALKFTHKGKVRFGYTFDKQELQFFVEDTGIGIPEEMQKIIFERFRQVDNTATRKYGGAGLGLALSKGYIELMGGSIWLKSEPGIGSLFGFSIPYKPVGKPEEDENSGQTAVILPFSIKKYILIAEDEDNNYFLITELLNRLNITPVRARNGHEAVEICLQDKLPDLILMDIKMPEMDGIEATRIIKKKHPDLPVIAITAYALPGDKKRVMEAGCDDYIEKPFLHGTFMAKILKYLH